MITRALMASATRGSAIHCAMGDAVARRLPVSAVPAAFALQAGPPDRRTVRSYNDSMSLTR